MTLYCPYCFLDTNHKTLVCQTYGTEGKEYIKTYKVVCGFCGNEHHEEEVIV
jgi:hypothetical protein